MSATNGNRAKRFCNATAGAWALGMAIVIAASATPGCGSYSTQGENLPFVGTWSCPTLPTGARTLEIDGYIDNSLSVTGDADGGSLSLFCASDLWSYSGSTVSMKSGTSCLGGPTGTAVITVESFSLTVNGATLSIDAKEQLMSAAAPSADGGDAGDASTGTAPKVDVEVLTLSGNCTRQ